MDKNKEYESLRQEILESQKVTNTIVISTATVSASLLIVGTQIDAPSVEEFAFLMPQMFVILALAYILRRGRLINRLATYIVVFHELPKGGWELYSRYPFSNSQMNAQRVQGKWRIPEGIYTTYGFLLAIMIASAGLLVTSKYFWPWRLIGILLPILTIGTYLFFDYKNRDWQQRCLKNWNDLKRLREEKSPEFIFGEIIGKKKAR
ncbi:hypothetical protein KAR91_58855 [Candidatus Pacearchaeota archaeon]|nr:hypothetical protein [Candidatus Pacearchaeota archaeon]